jgi:signal transduction histidine kinase
VRAPRLRTTLLAAFAYVLLLVIVALEVPLVLNLSKRVDAEVKAESAGQAALVAATAGDDRGNQPALRHLVRQSGEALGGRVIVVDRQGRLVADSAGSGLGDVSYADRPEIAQALRGETVQGTRDSESLGESILVSAVPIFHNGKRMGAVRISQSVEAVHSEIRDDALALIGIGLVALLLGIGVAWVLAGFLARPPATLACTARDVADGDLAARAPEQGPREQREVAAAFNEMTARLSSTLASQRDFVSNASHQLRTPLTGLRLRIEAAADKTTDAAVEEDLRAAEEELERFSALLGNLLTLARGDEQPARPSSASLAAEARAAAERWEGQATRAGQRIELRGEEEAEVAAAGEDIALALDNLIENALTYAPRGGQVEIAWGQRDGSGVVAVADDGPGLAPGEESRVLERFYRGEAGRGRPGTGLGLPIVRTIAERWGGSVRLANGREGGLRAVITLPLLSAGERLPSLHADFDKT